MKVREERQTCRGNDVLPAAMQATRCGRFIVIASVLGRVLGIGVLILLAGGCALGENVRTNAGRDAFSVIEDTDEAVVAVDLVAAMMQLPALSPFGSTLQFSDPCSVFGHALLVAIEEGGYGVQRVTEDQGLRYVTYGKSQVVGVDDAQIAYFVRVGKINVERRYRRRGAQLVPVSPIRVVGTEPVPLIVNDDPHRMRVGGGVTFPSGVVFMDEQGEVIERRDELVQASDGDSRRLGQSVSAQRSIVLARAALFQGDRIHREPDRYEGRRVPVWQVTLEFDTATSLRLGDSNKRALARLLARMETATDRLSISGCSHGKSLLWDGTESDALARSQRVKEELLLTGLSTSDVREEGCFNSLYGGKLAPNSVNVTLERFPGNDEVAEKST